MGYNTKHIMRRFLIGMVLLFANGTTALNAQNAQCVVSGTNFDTGKELCCPIMKSDDTGWYDEDLDWDKLCKTDMFVGPEYVKKEGLGGAFSSESSNDMTKANAIFLRNDLQADGSKAQYGYSIVTAQPKLIHSFCKANETPNNMYVNLGSAHHCPFVSYSVSGLNPGSSVELSFTVYNLLDPTYFDHLVNVQQVTSMNNYITKYTYESNKINGNNLTIGVVSNNDGAAFDRSYNNALKENSLTKATTKVVDFGKSATITHTTTVPESGNITFYFYRANDCFQIPIGIDDIKVTGEIKPLIAYTGNPCPEQPLRIFTGQTFPDGTTYSWKESKTGQTSTGADFQFVPDEAETDYSVTCEVTIPGCAATKSDAITIHSGTCCTDPSTGAPMAMTNLYYDDFGDFPTDNTYVWTDRYGITHTENIPNGQVHEAQSHKDANGEFEKIPYVKAYYIESTGAKLTVPALGSVPTPNGNPPQLYDHGVYAISKYGGYEHGVAYDNSGTHTGGMLQFDLLDEGTQDDFFEIDIDHICTGKEINFGADFASISQYPGSIEVTLEYNGNVLQHEYKYFKNGEDGWKHAGKPFKIMANEVGGADEISVKMKVRHYGIDMDGNPIYGLTRDYAIDNIIFQVCTPPDVNVKSSVNTGKDIFNLCTEDILTLTSVTSEAVDKFFLYENGQIDPNKEIGYIYQYTLQDPSTESTTNPIKWTTLHQEEVVKTNTFDVPVETYWDDIFSQLQDEQRVYFRVVIGEYSDLNDDKSWKTKSALSNCRKVSISTIPVMAGVNCAACEKVKEAAIISADPATKITTNSQSEKEVNLCPGEIAKLTTKAFAPTDPTVMGITVGPDNEPRKYIASWHKGSKKASGTLGANYTAGDETSSYNVTWEDADWYYLLVKDIEFPGDDGQSCWAWDSIHVIANAKPDETLTDPDPFCEGELNTEPTKAIANHDIIWYTANDTLQKTSEPAVSAVLAGDSPKTFYYVVKNTTTGCRSDVNEYTVTVSRIPSVDLDGTVADFCASVTDPSKQSPEATAIPSLPKPADASLTIDWYTDKNMQSAAQTDLSSLAGSLTPYTYYYKVTGGGCSDTSHITFNAKPTAMVTPAAAPVCDKTTLSVTTDPSTASVKWSNGQTVATYDITTAAEAGALTVTAEATGYCASAAGSITADFYESPAKLTTTTVQYLKTEPITDILTRKSDAVTGKAADGTIMWLGQFNDETEPASTSGASSTTPTPTAKNLASTEDETYYYWVFQQTTNPDGTTCQSGLTKLTVMILGAPAPLVSDTVYCLNDTPADLTKNARINQMDPNKTYELLWYDAQTGGTGSTTPPTVSTASAGETTYYVSQRDANSASNESSRMPIKVTVYKVPAPNIDPIADYCVGDIASPLPTDLTKDEGHFLMADRMVWSDGSTTGTTFTPSTTVSTTTTYTYSAKQYYKLSSGTECESEETTITVKVNFTPVPGNATVSYIAAEVESDNKTFPAITTKNWMEETGYTYYYALEGTTNFQKGAPKPKFDVSSLNGGTKKIQYSVYRVDDATGCKSEPSTITVTISDAFPPIVEDVLYCEGEALADLTAKRNPQGNKTEADYTLIWYGTTQPSSTTDPGTEADTYPLQGNATTSPAGEVTTTTYYVAQRDDNTGAVSPAQEIKVIVYPTPVLSITTPSAVCEANVNLATAVTLTNEVSGKTYDKTYFADANGSAPLANSLVSESGSYGVQYAYNANVNSGELCKSKIEAINVTVDTLTVLADNVTTCPEMSAKFTSEAQTNASTVTYAWSSADGNNGSAAEFETKKFIGGNYGDHYPYTLTVTAGTCSETLSLEVILGQGPVVGTMTIADPTNTEVPIKTYTNSLTSEEYYYCGSDVTVIPTYDGDGDYVLTTPSGATSSSSPFTVSEAGVYTLSYTNGCPTSVTFKLTDAQIALTNTTPSLGLCEGDNFTSSLTVTPASGPDYTLIWKKDDVAIDGETSSSYTINGAVAENSGSYAAEANRKGCVSTTEIGDLKVTAAISVTLPDEPTICEGEETELVITDIQPDGTTLEWQADPTILTATNSERVTVQPTFREGDGHQSTYTYTVTASNSGCERTYQVSVKVDEALKGDLTGVTTICEGNKTTLSAESYEATTYAWSLGDEPIATTAATTVSPEATSTYKIDVTRGVCTATDEIKVVVTTHPIILSMDSAGIRDRQIVMEPNRGSGVFTYWIDDDVTHKTTNTMITDLTFATHVIHVVDENGCGSTYQFTLDPPEIFIPSYFTPNGDGIHDRWIIGNLASTYPNAVVNIFDRYGKLMAQYLGAKSDGWDGTYQGKALPSTDYWYIIEIEEISKQFTGHFTLIRR